MQRQNRYPQHLIPDPFVYRKVLYRSRSNQLVRFDITNLKKDSSFEGRWQFKILLRILPKNFLSIRTNIAKSEVDLFCTVVFMAIHLQLIKPTQIYE